MTDSLYQVTLRNVPFKQAQALYRFLVNLEDEERMHGEPGMSWSGHVPSGDRNVHHGCRTVTLDPMPTHEQATRERELEAVLRDLCLWSSVHNRVDSESNLMNRARRLLGLPQEGRADHISKRLADEADWECERKEE